MKETNKLNIINPRELVKHVSENGHSSELTNSNIFSVQLNDIRQPKVYGKRRKWVNYITTMRKNKIVEIRKDK